MKIKVFTIFPEMLRPMLGQSILGRAIEAGLLHVDLIDIRAYAQNKHRNTDDYPFGGGAGMVMLAQPIVDAMQANVGQNARRVYLSPRGRTLNQRLVEELAQEEELALLCGHYEGVDERALQLCIDEEISIGDYVLTGGELGALVLIDAVARLIPGVLGSEASSGDESFSTGAGPASGLLEYPQYTRPAEFRGMCVPEPLLGGNHAAIEKWRRYQSLQLTRERRPDLLQAAELSAEDRSCLAALDARDRLARTLDARGIAWTALDSAQAEDFERRWLEAFVPTENLSRARRKCLPRRSATGGLEQAFLLDLIPEGGAKNLSKGPCTLFLTKARTGVCVDDGRALADLAQDGFDDLCIADATLSRTQLWAGGAWHWAAKVKEGS